MTNTRAFVLLRLTLIIATAYLLLVESEFAFPQGPVSMLLGAALASNLLLGHVDEQTTRTPIFGFAVVTFDTIWVTSALLYSGHFNAEFFFLYFFVILLAAIGESLSLIAVGAVVVCVGYVYLMIRSGQTPTLWDSPSLIRIPFLFTTTAFYGYLIERTREERRRAEIHESERDRAQSALTETSQQLEEEAAVTSALAQVGQDLISSLDTPVLLDRLCQQTAAGLRSDMSSTLLLASDEDVFRPVASFGFSPELLELISVLEVPRKLIEDLISTAGDEGVVRVDAGRHLVPTVIDHADHGQTQLLIPLRRGGELIGVQVATWFEARPPMSRTDLRVARGIGQLASMALANARLVEELENANQLKSDFVASMSHELRTPLNLIIGYTDLILDGTFGPVCSDQVDTLRRVDKSARELLDLIEATLDLSRLEAKRVPLHLSEVNLREMLGDLQVEFENAGTRDGVDMIWEIPDERTKVCTDAVKLRMVLKNLIGNAIKFTNEGSISTSVELENGRAVFKVEDTGMGIAPGAQARIFEPFRQADRSISPAFGGVGLGLYIVSRLVENLHGTISLESEVDRGATFRITMPINLRDSLRSVHPQHPIEFTLSPPVQPIGETDNGTAPDKARAVAV